jgi:hypothetical protein
MAPRHSFKRKREFQANENIGELKRSLFYISLKYRKNGSRVRWVCEGQKQEED